MWTAYLCKYWKTTGGVEEGQRVSCAGFSSVPRPKYCLLGHVLCDGRAAIISLLAAAWWWANVWCGRTEVLPIVQKCTCSLSWLYVSTFLRQSARALFLLGDITISTCEWDMHVFMHTQCRRFIFLRSSEKAVFSNSTNKRTFHRAATTYISFEKRDGMSSTDVSGWLYALWSSHPFHILCTSFWRLSFTIMYFPHEIILRTSKVLLTENPTGWQRTIPFYFTIFCARKCGIATSTWSNHKILRFELSALCLVPYQLLIYFSFFPLSFFVRKNAFLFLKWQDQSLYVSRTHRTCVTHLDVCEFVPVSVVGGLRSPGYTLVRTVLSHLANW